MPDANATYRKDTATKPFDIDRANKDQLKARIAVLEAKLEQAPEIPNLEAATTGQIWEEVYIRLNRNKMMHQKGNK